MSCSPSLSLPHIVPGPRQCDLCQPPGVTPARVLHIQSREVGRALQNCSWRQEFYWKHHPRCRRFKTFKTLWKWLSLPVINPESPCRITHILDTQKKEVEVGSTKFLTSCTISPAQRNEVQWNKQEDAKETSAAPYTVSLSEYSSLYGNHIIPLMYSLYIREFGTDP